MKTPDVPAYFYVSEGAGAPRKLICIDRVTGVYCVGERTLQVTQRSPGNTQFFQFEGAAERDKEEQRLLKELRRHSAEWKELLSLQKRSTQS